MTKFIWFPISWVLFLLLRTFLIALGYIMVPIGVLFKAYEVRKSKYYDRTLLQFTWPILYLWNNFEEGIGHYGNPKWPLWVRILYSEVWRNPANGLRFVPVLSLKIDPDKIEFIGSFGSSNDHLSTETLKAYDADSADFWSLTWHGLYSNIRWQGSLFGKRFRFWCGWKAYPGDILGIPDWDHRKVRAGFATQFRRLRG
jgi:hypothetical protein